MYAALLVSVLDGGSSHCKGQTKPSEPHPACSCPDGRQFSTGSSIFGENSARVSITGFHRDLGQPEEPNGLPRCKQLTVIGQTVRLEVIAGHPFLRREDRKRGTIPDICNTRIQFAEARKSYDFFKDDGSALTLGDVNAGQTPDEESANTQGRASGDPSATGGVIERDDLTGKDLIRMIPAQDPGQDPSDAAFGVEDLKEGAYFIVRRQVKAAPAVDDALGTKIGTPPKTQGEVTVWAGSLGRIQSRAGFRDGPLWIAEVLPYSAPPSFSYYLHSVPSAFRKHRPVQTKVVLASGDIVEINHFLDKYSLEWTRFGADSDQARERESAGTTFLNDLYSAHQPDLDENLQTAKDGGIERDIRKAATRLSFRFKDPGRSMGAGPLVLEAENATGTAEPHYFHQQCFVERHEGLAGSRTFAVSGTDLAIFQPEDSPQIPKDYYAVDVRLQLKSERGEFMQIVCRFPSAAVEESLLDNARRILSGVFSITSLPE